MKGGTTKLENVTNNIKRQQHLIQAKKKKENNDNYEFALASESLKDKKC